MNHFRRIFAAVATLAGAVLAVARRPRRSCHARPATR